MAQHKIDGTNRSYHEGAMDLPAGTPHTPEYLRGDALAEWNRIVKELGPTKVLSATDQGMLAAYCDALATYRNLLLRIEAEDWISIGSTGRETAHHLIPAMHTARADMLRFGREFGLTPSARTSIKVPPAQEKSDLEKGMLGIVG